MTSSTSISSISKFIPHLTVQDVKEWASFGPPVREKPSSKDEITALKERKFQRNETKQRLLWEVHNNNNKNTSDVSARLVEQELDRLATRLLWGPEKNNGKSRTTGVGNDHLESIETQDPTLLVSSLSLSSTTSHPCPIPDDPSLNIVDHRWKESENGTGNGTGNGNGGGPLLEYLWAPKANPIQGQSMYLGGEVGSDGNIYCIPGHASRVLQINTTNNTIQPIGPILTTSTKNGCQRLYKWLRGIVVEDVIYGLPCHADEILRIDVAKQQITKIDIPYEDFYCTPDNAKIERDRPWKYHGGSICPIDNCIYAIPQAATHVLKFDPTTETITFVGPPLPGKCKWYGGIVGKQDGAIYGIPQNAAGVLRITPDAITVHGDYGSNNHKWHGGAAAHNGVIVSVPANANTVLLVTPSSALDGEPTLTEIGNDKTIQSGRHRSDGKYKYLGAMAGTNGKVYLFPCASEYVLQVDTVHGIVKNVGPNLRDVGMESVHQNKWQNGLTCVQNSCVYGMPLSGRTLLRIDCSNTTLERDSPDPIVTTWELPPPKIDCRDKFEGGVITKSGIMYTVPNNHKGVLRIVPSGIEWNDDKASS